MGCESRSDPGLGDSEYKGQGDTESKRRSDPGPAEAKYIRRSDPGPAALCIKAADPGPAKSEYRKDI